MMTPHQCAPVVYADEGAFVVPPHFAIRSPFHSFGASESPQRSITGANRRGLIGGCSPELFNRPLFLALGSVFVVNWDAAFAPMSGSLESEEPATTRLRLRFARV
jgi:hypothetical protein